MKLNHVMSMVALIFLLTGGVAISYPLYHALQSYYDVRLISASVSLVVVVSLFTVCFQIFRAGANFRSCSLYAITAIAVVFISSSYFQGVISSEEGLVEKSFVPNSRITITLHSSVIAILPFASAAIPLLLVAVFSKTAGVKKGLESTLSRIPFPSYELVWKYIAAVLFGITFIVALIWFANPDKNYEPTIVLLSISMVGLEFFRRN